MRDAFIPASSYATIVRERIAEMAKRAIIIGASRMPI